MPNIKSIPLKTKELQRYVIGTPWICHRYTNGHAMATPLAYARDSPIPMDCCETGESGLDPIQNYLDKLS